MKLQSLASSSEGPSFTQDGRIYHAIDIASKYLRCMRDFALDNIRQSVDDLRESEIRWVLTVPAIWRDAEKRWMREAAARAGFPRDEEQVILALEPEAAALYCVQRSEVMQSVGAMPAGTRFMVLDAGGGTVDLTTHEVMEGGGLREVITGGGGPCGSTRIDKNFRDYLGVRLAPDVVKRFHDNDPPSFVELMNIWERTKCNPSVESELRFLEIPGKLLRLLMREAPDVLDRLANDQEGEDSKLVMKRSEFQALFEPVLREIVAVTREQFDKLAAKGMSCDYLFLVGGFAESPLLHARVVKEFGRHVKHVIKPPEPGKAVLHGAALFGLDPNNMIRERTMRLTYGYEVSQRREAEDPAELHFKHTETGEEYSRGRFVAFVNQGDSIKVDHKICKEILPLYDTQTEIALNLYTSSSPKTKYVTESGVTEIAKLTIISPINGKKRTERLIDLAFHFGRTEIRAEAIDRNSGQKVESPLSYRD